MKGFWNDANGLTVVDILALALGLGTGLAYWRYGSVDTNYADIVIAALIASAGQAVGLTVTRRGMQINNSNDEQQPPI